MYPRPLSSIAVAVVAMAAAAAAGCKAGGYTAAFRSTSGAATAYPGLAGGRTSSIVIGDRGGLLTRVGLGGLAALAGGLGSIKDAKRETTVERQGDTIVTTHEDTATIDPAAAQAMQPVVDAAADPNSDLSSMSATLEIASRDLGGDTSGWMFRLGGYAKAWRGRVGLRGSIGVGFGSFTFHGRTLAAYESGGVSMRKDEFDYTYIGTPVRFGLMLRGSVRPARSQPAAEVFVQADVNWVALAAIIAPDESWSPSPWHTGLRLSLGPLYVEGVVSASTMRASRTSLGLEAGLDF